MKFFLSIILSFVVSMGFAQRTEALTLYTPTGDLMGTMVLPEEIEQFPIVLIQAGSGPTDRDGNSPFGVRANSYRMIADALARKGIATVLMDKRGIAASTPAGTDESELRFTTYVDDLISWVKYIEKDKRVESIALAGHSEGSLVAMLAAEKVKVHSYISIAGTGENISKTLVGQVSAQDENTGAVLDSLLIRIKAGKSIAVIPPGLGGLLRPSVLPYMRSWMQQEPCSSIKKLKIPILILQGSTDIQVDTTQGYNLHACAKKSQLLTIQGMNHILKNAPAEREANLAAYNNRDLPIPEELITALATFIKDPCSCLEK